MSEIRPLPARLFRLSPKTWHGVCMFGVRLNFSLI